MCQVTEPEVWESSYAIDESEDRLGGAGPPSSQKSVYDFIAGPPAPGFQIHGFN